MSTESSTGKPYEKNDGYIHRECSAGSPRDAIDDRVIAIAKITDFLQGQHAFHPRHGVPAFEVAHQLGLTPEQVLVAAACCVSHRCSITLHRRRGEVPDRAELYLEREPEALLKRARARRLRAEWLLGQAKYLAGRADAMCAIAEAAS